MMMYAEFVIVFQLALCIRDVVQCKGCHKKILTISAEGTGMPFKDSV